VQNVKLVDQLQFLAFMDYGFVVYVDPIPTNNNTTPPAPGETTAHLWSVGGGLRYTVNRYLNVRFDYGVQLHDSGPTASDYGSRGHIGVIASF
jgi:hemolysin activation/secretion protein